MPKVSITDIEEVDLPQRGKMHSKRNRWHRLWKKKRILSRKISTNISHIDDSNSKLSRELNKPEFKCLRNSRVILKDILPDNLKHHLTMGWYIFNSTYYVDEDGHIHKGRDLLHLNDRELHRYRPYITPKNIQERKLIRQQKAMIRYCSKGNALIESFLRVDFEKQAVNTVVRRESFSYWRPHRYVYRYYNLPTLRYTNYTKLVDDLTKFYEIPYAFYQHPHEYKLEDRKFTTNITYKRYMK